MKCSACGFEFQDSNFCPACGAPAPAQPAQGAPQQQPCAQQPYGQPQYAQQPYGQPQYAPPPAYTQQTVVVNSTQEQTSEKSRNIYALLGFFLGGWGIHEFYIGRVGNGIAVILANFLCTPLVVAIYVAISLMTNHKDSDGMLLKDDKSPLAVILGIIMLVVNLIVWPIIFFFIAGVIAAAAGNSY